MQSRNIIQNVQVSIKNQHWDVYNLNIWQRCFLYEDFKATLIKIIQQAIMNREVKNT